MTNVDGAVNNAQAEALQRVVEAGVSTMAIDGRLAGPATHQEDLGDLVPSPDSLGAYAQLADGTLVLVLVTRAAAESLSPGCEPAAIAGALSPTLDAVAAALGQQPTMALALADGNAALALIQPGTTVVAAGVFEGNDVFATVAAIGSPNDPTAMGGAPTGLQTGGQPGAGTASGALPSSVPPQNLSAQVERSLQMLSDVNLDLTAELGRTNVAVSELLDIAPGTILELDNPAGSPVDLYVNGTLFARAEVIVVNDAYAVRIKELLGDGRAT